MTPPTAIEIVRAHIEAMREIRSHGGERVTTALASVLRDAERFQALERAHWDHVGEGWSMYEEGPEGGSWCIYHSIPLAELADKLRSEQ